MSSDPDPHHRTVSSSTRAARSLIALFLFLGLVEVRMPFILPPPATDWDSVLCVFLFWCWRAAFVPLVFAIDRLMARRLIPGLLAHVAGLQLLAMLTSTTYGWFSWTQRMEYSQLLYGILTTPTVFLVYMTTAGTAAVVRYGELVAARRVKEQQAQAALASRALLAMRSEVHGDIILTALERVEELLGRDVAEAERMVTLLSDFLLPVMRRSARERVRLGLELEFVIAWLRLRAALDGARCDGRIENYAASTQCEPGALAHILNTFAAKPPREIVLRAEPLNDGAVMVDAQTSSGHASTVVRELAIAS
jgi:hypothetical protein